MSDFEWTGFEQWQDHPCCLTLFDWVRKFGARRVIDLGCGDGRDLVLMKRNGLIDYGFGIDILDEHFPKFIPNDGIEYRRGDVLDVLDVLRGWIPERSVDMVVSNNFLEHCTEPLRIARETRRVIKTGGHYFHTMPNLRNHCDPHHKNFFDTETLISYFNEPWGDTTTDIIACRGIGEGCIFIAGTLLR